VSTRNWYIVVTRLRYTARNFISVGLLVNCGFIDSTRVMSFAPSWRMWRGPRDTQASQGRADAVWIAPMDVCCARTDPPASPLSKRCHNRAAMNPLNDGDGDDDGDKEQGADKDEGGKKKQKQKQKEQNGGQQQQEGQQQERQPEQ
jgi:hypothetical protein